jgi:UDP-glucose 4-epimerase
MLITIFGGGGFIGSTIADRLLVDGHKLKIFERPRVSPYREFKAPEQVEWIVGDLSNTHDVSDAVCGSDAIIHLVSTTLPKNSNDDPIYDVQSNVIASLHILNAMVHHKVKKIIFISSGGTIYGNPLFLPINENHPTNPLVSYGITKLAIEKYLYMYEHLHGLIPITLRVANPYGERQRIETAQGAVGIFLHRALNGLHIDIWGDGSITRDYIHVDDVAEAFLKALNYGGKYRVFNVGSGVGTSLNSLIDELENVLEKKISRRYLPGRPFDIPANVLSNILAHNELNWTPMIPLSSGIARTSKWIKKELIKNNENSAN